MSGTDWFQIAKTITANHTAAAKAGDVHGASNHALRHMIAQCREALCEMDDLDDNHLPIEVVRMRRLIREAIATAREVIHPMDEAARAEIREIREYEARQSGVGSREEPQC